MTRAKRMMMTLAAAFMVIIAAVSVFLLYNKNRPIHPKDILELNEDNGTADLILDLGTFFEMANYVAIVRYDSYIGDLVNHFSDSPLTKGEYTVIETIKGEDYSTVKIATMGGIVPYKDYFFNSVAGFLRRNSDIDPEEHLIAQNKWYEENKDDLPLYVQYTPSYRHEVGKEYIVFSHGYVDEIDAILLYVNGSDNTILPITEDGNQVYNSYLKKYIDFTTVLEEDFNLPKRETMNIQETVKEFNHGPQTD